MNGSNLLARYTWMVDTIRRYGRITREELNKRWQNADVSGGAPLPRRTFYNYRQAIAELFGVEIGYDRHTNEYFIEGDDSDTNNPRLTDWLLNSAAVSGMLTAASAASSRIFVEEIPSARQNLAPILDAINQNLTIRFSYHPFTRSQPTHGIVVEPYLLKLFRQRWYVAGMNRKEDRLKTYALDRISNIELTSARFEMPNDFDPAEYFRHSFGIVADASAPRHVMIRTTPAQAKYLRALPLHSSQQELVHSDYSEFTYHILLTEEFLRELMMLGPEITVVHPGELRAMLTDRLKRTLSLYEPDNQPYLK